MVRICHFFCFSVFVMILAVCTGSFVQAEPGITPTHIVIGQSCALSGPIKDVGKGLKNGALAYFTQVNASGGIKGRQIKFVTLDDRYDTAQCVSNTEQLINKDNVFLLFSYLGTPMSQAVLETVKKNQVPFFAPYTGAEFLREPLVKEVFNIRASYKNEIGAIIEAVLMKNLKKISVFYVDADFGKTGLGVVASELKKRGLKIHSSASYNIDTQDVAKAVDSISASAPDAVIIISTTAPAASFIEQMRSQKKSKAVMLGISTVGGDLLATTLANKGVGVVVAQTVPFPFDKRVPVVAEYQKLSETFTSEAEPGYYGLEGFIAAKVLCEILARMPNMTRQDFIATAEKMYEYIGGYKVNFTPQSHNGSDMVQFTQISPGGFLGSIENLNQIYE